MSMFLRPSRGFTLVEMIVVISIAGILAAVAFASYSDSRAQARDRLRQAQMEQLRVALELYKDDHGRYPENGCGATASQWAGPTGDGSWNAVCEDYIIGHAPGIDFVPTYIDELPVDPRPRASTSNLNIYYRTNDIGSTYQILHHQTVERLFTDAAKTSPYSRYTRKSPPCNAVQTNSYSVHAEGLGECW